MTTRFFWQDLAGEPPKEKYDLVIMNPPFHEGPCRRAALSVRAMIKAAADALRGGGELLMVANRGLPYEPVLGRSTSSSMAKFAEMRRFKVLWAKALNRVIGSGHVRT
ncbi:MAG: methyltransferase [Rhizobium sp.]|nr:methyltransferase [Rhizobium sp.]